MDIFEFSHDDRYVVAPTGRLDALTSSTLREKLTNLINEGKKYILLDCSSLDYVSSAGIRVLFETIHKLGAVQGKLLCCSPSADVKRIFDMVDLQADMPIYESREEALKAFDE